MKIKNWIPATLVLLTTAPVFGQEPQLRCEDSDASYLECFKRVLKEAEGEVAGEETEEDVASKATPEESPEAAAGLRNFLPNFLAALGLGELSQDEGTLTFTVNPELLSWGTNQLSLQTILREADVFEPLVQAIPEEIREERKASLTEGLDQDFGDVEATLAWTVESERFGRDFRPHRQTISDLYTPLFSQAVRASGTSAEQNFTQVLRQFPEISLTHSVAKIRSDKPEQALILEKALVEAALEIARRQLALVNLTGSTGFFRLADLINNQPQIHVTGAYRSRDRLAGQDEWSINGTFEYTFQNLNRWKKGCAGKADVMCLAKYFSAHKTALKYSPRFTLAAEFGRTSDYDFALPDDNFVFHLDEIEKRIGSLTYGQYLSLDKEGNQDARLDIEAKYEDVTGDPMRNNRFVSTATLTQRLPNKMSASVTLVYADKPEYRGEVDEELSARVGLRFKVDPEQP